MFRLSKLADYAIVTATGLGSAGPAVLTATELAERSGLPAPTVAKVLKLLAKGEIVISTRGATGGYRLARPLEAITVAEVITAIDGPIALTACVEGGGEGCGVSACCPMRGNWAQVNRAVEQALGSVSLAQMLPEPGAARRGAAAHGCASQPAA